MCLKFSESFHLNVVFFFLSFLISCSEKTSKDKLNEYPKIISLDDSNSMIKGKFYENFQLKEVVELENRSGYFLSEISKIDLINSGFIVFDNELDNLLNVDFKGNIINRICEIGEGPDQMPSISDYAFDSIREEIYVIGPGNFRVKVFRLDGTFVRDFKMETQADQITLLGDKPVLTLTYYNPYFKYLSVLNNNGDTLKTTFPFPKETFPIGLQHISGNLTNSYLGGVLVNEPASSTLYSLDQELNFTPRYKFESSNDLWPEEDRHDLNAYFERLSSGNLSFLTNFYEESESYLFFNLNVKKTEGSRFVIDPRIGYYNVNTGQSFLSDKEEFMLDIKGPLAVTGNDFYVYIPKMNLAELVQSGDDIWKAIMADFPEIRILEKADYDTPVLLKFGVK